MSGVIQALNALQNWWDGGFLLLSVG